MSDFGVLLGKDIDDVFVSDDQQYIKFRMYGREFVFVTDGDCCSETWFADIIGRKNLTNEFISGVETLELPSDPKDGRSRQEYDQVYGVRFKTKRGDCDVIYRNSSNGYYGGSASLCNEPPEGIKWEKITGDWQASNPVDAGTQ